MHKKEISPSTGPQEERSPKSFVKASSIWCLGIIPQAWMIPSLPHQACQLSSVSPDKRSPTGLAGDVKFLRNLSALINESFLFIWGSMYMARACLPLSTAQDGCRWRRGMSPGSGHLDLLCQQGQYFALCASGSCPNGRYSASDRTSH